MRKVIVAAATLLVAVGTSLMTAGTASAERWQCGPRLNINERLGGQFCTVFRDDGTVWDCKDFFYYGNYVTIDQPMECHPVP